MSPLEPVPCRVLASWKGGELAFCECVIRVTANDGSGEIFARAPLVESERLPVRGTIGIATFFPDERKWRFKAS